MPRPPAKGKSEADNRTKRQQPERQMEYRQAPDFASLYANNVQLRSLPWDIQLTFGEVLSVDESKMVIENRIAVNLSPQTAKSLLNVLQGVVKQYESQLGEIRYSQRQESSDAELP